jgi:hypothetical protein
MLMKFKFLAAAVLLFPASAMAQTCGTAPARPAIPKQASLTDKSTADVETAQHQAFASVKDWQSAVKPYRDCLTGIVNGDKQKIAGAGTDATQIAQWKAESAAADHAFDVTVDTEELMVADFHAIQAAYCMRKDSDAAACPK